MSEKIAKILKNISYFVFISIALIFMIGSFAIMEGPATEMDNEYLLVFICLIFLALGVVINLLGDSVADQFNTHEQSWVLFY